MSACIPEERIPINQIRLSSKDAFVRRLNLEFEAYTTEQQKFGSDDVVTANQQALLELIDLPSVLSTRCSDIRLDKLWWRTAMR